MLSLPVGKGIPSFTDCDAVFLFVYSFVLHSNQKVLRALFAKMIMTIKNSDNGFR